MNWRRATEEERKILFNHLDDYFWDDDLEWYDVLQELGLQQYNPNTEFLGNFKRGRFCRKTAKKLYKWYKFKSPERYTALERILSTDNQVE